MQVELDNKIFDLGEYINHLGLNNEEVKFLNQGIEDLLNKHIIQAYGFPHRLVIFFNDLKAPVGIRAFVSEKNKYFSIFVTRSTFKNGHYDIQFEYNVYSRVANVGRLRNAPKEFIYATSIDLITNETETGLT